MEERAGGWLIFAANAIFGHSLNMHGWVYLVVGIVLIVCAGGVLAQSQISRWVGIFAGGVMAISAIYGGREVTA